MRKVGFDVCQALDQNAQRLSLDEAWKLLKLLDELAPLERGVAGPDKDLEKQYGKTQNFAQVRAAARDSLFDRCASLTRKAAKEGHDVFSGFEAHREQGHEDTFASLRKILKTALFSKNDVVLINVALGNGQEVVEVPIPKNFFKEVGELLAGSPDSLVIGGVNIGALLGQHYRGRIQVPTLAAGEHAAHSYRNDARAAEVLLQTLASFCRTKEELTALAGLLTSTGTNIVNLHYKTMARDVIAGARNVYNALTQVDVVDEGKRFRIDRTADGAIEVLPMFNLRFESSGGAPCVFDVEDSHGVVLPAFHIHEGAEMVNLAHIEHYSIFSQNVARSRPSTLA